MIITTARTENTAAALDDDHCEHPDECQCAVCLYEHADWPVSPVYRIELWRQDPPALLVAFLHDDQLGGPSWSPDPGMLPANWPVGYEWRRIPLPGSEVPAAAWSADWRTVHEYDQVPRFLAAPPDEYPTSIELD